MNKPVPPAPSSSVADEAAAHFELMETGHGAAFHTLTRLAQQIFGVDYASVALLRGDSFDVYSHQVLPVPHFPRAGTFSEETVESGQPLVVLDAHADARFVDNPYAQSLKPPYARFYAGAPVWLEGAIIGAFGLIDQAPRASFGDNELAMLDSLAAQASNLFRLSQETRARQAVLTRLERQRQQLDLMQDMTQTGYYRYDFKSRHIEMSKGVRDIYRLAPDAPTPDVDACMAMIIDPDVAELGAEINKARETRLPFTMRMRIVAPGDQSVRTLVSTGHVERTSDGEPSGLFSIVQDVTEEVKRQRAFEENRQRLEMIEAATGVGFWYQKLDEPLLQWSRGIFAIVEEDPETFKPQHSDIMMRLVHADDQPWVGETVKRAVTEGEPYDIIFRLRRRSDDSFRHIRNIGNVERDASGRIIALYGIALDVTDAQTIADGLRKAKQAAEALSRAKGDFIANISHDLRTPLATITGYADWLLQDESLSDVNRAHITHITQASRTLSFLVNDILDASRLDRGQMDLNPASFDLRVMLNEVAAQGRMLLHDKPVSLVTQWDGDLPTLDAVRVYADSLRLRQVMQNLMTNACKFTSTGQVTLTAHLEAVAEGYALSVSIADTGAGIDDVLKPHVFERFTHADSSLNRMAGGSGLGLSIAHELVRLMGGEIGFESTAGKGSRFYFTVPLKAAPSHDLLPMRQIVTESPVVTETFRVLIVDDHRANRELLRLRLQAFGAEVDEASDGAEAVVCANQTPYDAIFMDIQMPVMDGLTATRAIRGGSGPNAEIPIIALSAMPNDALNAHNETESAKGYGFTHTLTKPIETALLARILAELG